MSADNDGDSHMTSSTEDSDLEADTVKQRQTLSPPRSVPPHTSGSSIANANGKRPLNTISNGTEEDTEGSTSAAFIAPSTVLANGKVRQDFPPKVHTASGYTWNRIEDEPGATWLNKKAMDEYNRAWDSLSHRDSMIKGRYGDPFEAVAKERGLLNSMKEQ